MWTLLFFVAVVYLIYTAFQFHVAAGIGAILAVLAYGYFKWYADFCVRVNHKGAEYFALDNAVAVAGFTTDREALITGVAVEKSQRKKGLGATAVKGLIGKLKVKNPDIKVFVCAVEDRVKFYEKIGFEVLGQVAVLEF